VTVQAGSSAINGWTVRWTLASGQAISQLWNGALSTSGSAVTVKNLSYNGALAAGGSTTFGFTGTGSPSTPAPTCTSP
jgi:cellulase/cellobiase CelA1